MNDCTDTGNRIVSTREAMLAAIYHDPHEDSVRLGYADWLDEHGDDHGRRHAELIRVQCELARTPVPGSHARPDCRFVKADPDCPRCAWGLKQLREQELLAAVEPVVRRGARCETCNGKGDWFDGYDRWKNCPNRYCRGGYTGTLAAVETDGREWTGPLTEEQRSRVLGPWIEFRLSKPSWHHRCDWSRGFPQKVYCTLDEYRREVGRKGCENCKSRRAVSQLNSATGGITTVACIYCRLDGTVPVTWAEQLLREHGTVTEMVLTDREPQEEPTGDPNRYGTSFDWLDGAQLPNSAGSEVLSADLFRAVLLQSPSFYNPGNCYAEWLTRDDTLAALSRAAADHARELAGLPRAWSKEQR